MCCFYSASGMAAYLITAAQAAVSFVCQQGPAVLPTPVRRPMTMSLGALSAITDGDDGDGA